MPAGHFMVKGPAQKDWPRACTCGVFRRLTSGRSHNVEWLGKGTRGVEELVSHFRVQSGGRVGAVLRRHSAAVPEANHGPMGCSVLDRDWDHPALLPASRCFDGCGIANEL